MVPCDFRGVNAPNAVTSGSGWVRRRSYLTGMARFVGEEEEQLSWSDQAEFPSSNLLDRPGILSKAVCRLSESLILKTEPAEIVGQHSVPLACLERVDQAVLADERVGDERGGTKYEGAVHEAADPDGWRSKT